MNLLTDIEDYINNHTYYFRITYYNIDKIGFAVDIKSITDYIETLNIPPNTFTKKIIQNHFDYVNEQILLHIEKNTIPTIEHFLVNRYFTYPISIDKYIIDQVYTNIISPIKTINNYVYQVKYGENAGKYGSSLYDRGFYNKIDDCYNDLIKTMYNINKNTIYSFLVICKGADYKKEIIVDNINPLIKSACYKKNLIF
jgi:hypothetical protein